METLACVFDLKMFFYFTKQLALRLRYFQGKTEIHAVLILIFQLNWAASLKSQIFSNLAARDPVVGIADILLGLGKMWELLDQLMRLWKEQSLLRRKLWICHRA